MQARGRERESGRTSLSLEFVDGDFFKTILIASELYKMVPDKVIQSTCMQSALRKVTKINHSVLGRARVKHREARLLGLPRSNIPKATREPWADCILRHTLAKYTTHPDQMIANEKAPEQGKPSRVKSARS